MALVRATRWLQASALKWRHFSVAPRRMATASGGTIPSDEEQATGIEKKEVDALIAGIDDPFNMSVQQGPWGTKDSPRLVPSMFPERIVGCICHEDIVNIQWMNLKQGPAQRCHCGHWFQLVKGTSLKIKLYEDDE